MKKGLLAAGLALALITPLAQADQAAVDRLRDAGFPLTTAIENEVLSASANQIGSVLPDIVYEAVRADPASAADIVSSAIMAEPGQAAAIATAAVVASLEQADAIIEAAIDNAPDQAKNIRGAVGDVQTEIQQDQQTVDRATNPPEEDIDDNIASDS